VKINIFLIFVVALCVSHIACMRAGNIKIQDRAQFNSYVKLYQSDNWETRRKAIAALAELDYSLVEDILIQAADDIHPLVRIEALKGLSRSAGSKVLGKIKIIAEYDKNNNVRWYALKALTVYKDPAAASVFVKGFSSEDWLIREESIKGMLMIDDFAIKYVSVPFVIAALEDQNINVKLTALEYLNFKDERIYSVLVESIDRDITGENTILKALLRAIKGYKLDPATKKKIASLLTHPNLDIRLLAFRALKADAVLLKTK
jgi:HEAT repeat protein